jgi:3-deoxy-D-manno-octulosonic-acid transferase
LGGIFYHIGNSFYFFALYLASCWNSKAKKWVRGRKNWKSKITAFKKQQPSKVVWMHCASLGEFEQGRPVFEQLKNTYSGYRFVISFFSPSGYEIQKDYRKADAIFYLPVNRKKNAAFLIELLDPALVIWVKYDYWSSYLFELKRKKIPVLLVSAIFNKQQKDFRFFGSFLNKMLASFTNIFVQDEASAERLKKWNLNNVTIAGDTRFDRVLEIAKQNTENRKVAGFCRNQQVIIAGSTWLEDEEELCHFANNNPGIRFIIAPHNISEYRLLETEKLFRHCFRYSRMDNKESDHVMLLDNMGLLSELYKYATICFIGGGFHANGVHNVLEAAVFGKPVLFGPEYEKYKEAVDLVALEAAFPIAGALELEDLCYELLADTEWYSEISGTALAYVKEHAGGTEKIIHYIAENRLLTRL